MSVYGVINTLTHSEMHSIFKRIFTKKHLLMLSKGVQSQKDYNDASGDTGRIAAVRACQLSQIDAVHAVDFGEECRRATKSQIIERLLDNDDAKVGRDMLRVYARYALKSREKYNVSDPDENNDYLVRFLAIGFDAWLRYQNDVLETGTQCKTNEVVMSFNLDNDTFCPLLTTHRPGSKCCEQHADDDGIHDSIQDANDVELSTLVHRGRLREAGVFAPRTSAGYNMGIVSQCLHGNAAVEHFSNKCDANIPPEHRLVSFSRAQNGVRHYINCFDLRKFKDLVTRKDVDPLFGIIGKNDAPLYQIMPRYTTKRVEDINAAIECYRKNLSFKMNAEELNIVNIHIVPFLSSKWSMRMVAALSNSSLSWIKEQVVNRQDASFLTQSAPQVRLLGNLLLKFIETFMCMLAGKDAVHIDDPYDYFMKGMSVLTPLPKTMKQDTTDVIQVLNTADPTWYKDTSKWLQLLEYVLRAHNGNGLALSSVWDHIVDSKDHKLTQLVDFNVDASLIMTLTSVGAEVHLQKIALRDTSNQHIQDFLHETIGLSEDDLRVNDKKLPTIDKVLLCMVLPTIVPWVMVLLGTLSPFTNIQQLIELCKHTTIGRDSLSWYFAKVTKYVPQFRDVLIFVIKIAIRVTKCRMAALGYLHGEYCSCLHDPDNDEMLEWLEHISKRYQ